jgi:hypothetical protein
MKTLSALPVFGTFLLIKSPPMPSFPRPLLLSYFHRPYHIIRSISWIALQPFEVTSVLCTFIRGILEVMKPRLCLPCLLYLGHGTQHPVDAHSAFCWMNNEWMDSRAHPHSEKIQQDHENIHEIQCITSGKQAIWKFSIATLL